MALPTSEFEYPKRLTAINPITGALIKSRGTNQDVYADGWDRIFGNAPIEHDDTQIEFEFLDHKEKIDEVNTQLWLEGN